MNKARTAGPSARRLQWVRFVKFTAFSLSAGVIQIISGAVFKELFHMEESLSYLLALVLSVLWNFTLNRRFTFQSAGNIPKTMLLVAAYYTVFSPVSTWWVGVLTKKLELLRGISGHNGRQFHNRVPVPAVCGISQDHGYQ